jgi:hypothetical protein
VPGWLDSTAGPPVVVATILATVDLDRRLADAGLVGEPLADDPHLGAAVRLTHPPDGDRIAFLEPVTEGRLARTLARNDEGPAGQYVAAADGLDAAIARAVGAGVSLSAVADGPFGRSVLVRDGSASGPHLVIVERPAGTIAR